MKDECTEYRNVSQTVDIRIAVYPLCCHCAGGIFISNGNILWDALGYECWDSIRFAGLGNRFLAWHTVCRITPKMFPFRDTGNSDRESCPDCRRCLEKYFFIRAPDIGSWRGSGGKNGVAGRFSGFVILPEPENTYETNFSSFARYRKNIAGYWILNRISDGTFWSNTNGEKWWFTYVFRLISIICAGNVSLPDMTGRYFIVPPFSSIR